MGKPASAPSSRADAESLVRSWGFPHVFSWTDGSNAHYPPHSHAALTTHLILRGELTIAYPDDHVEEAAGARDQRGTGSSRSSSGGSGRETFGPGARVDVAAGRVHEVWMGRDGCTYVIGE